MLWQEWGIEWVDHGFAQVTVVIHPLDHAFTVKYSDHVWHSPRDLSYYSLSRERESFSLVAVKSFHGESVIHKRRGVKALHFRLWFHPTCTRVWKKIQTNTVINSAERTLNVDFAAGEALLKCRKSTHYLHLKRLIWAHFGFNSSQCNRYCEKTLSYSKKYGVLSRPGYLSRCMHSNNSNNMCSPNSVFLSVEENQKRSVIEDKWRLERT